MQKPDAAPDYERRYVLFFALFCGLLAILPNLYGLISAPPGATYLGFEWSTDDQMVYAAWMRQAMDGQFFFDNRFTTDAQPALTVHIYFWVLGQIARFTGIAVAATLAKFAFSFLFVLLAHRFIRRITQDTFTIKLALTFAVFGAGVGFLVWHRFGEHLVLPKAQFLAGVLQNKLPTDVWQPEGFVFPSMLTTNLFMVSLCLILFIFTAFLDARESWKPVLPGALAMLVLMNIHSYDVLLIALVMAAFLGASLLMRQVTWAWLVRAVVIAAGAIPSALWFVNVLNNDPVFQARAATETFSPTFRQVVFGYLPLIVLALVWLVRRDKDKPDIPVWQRFAPLALGMVLIAFFALAGSHAGNSYWLTMGPWIGAFALIAVAAIAAARTDLTTNLIVCWAAVGLIAPYFPGLFQRKLLMGLSVPWAILAAFGFAAMLKPMERGQRNLVALLGIVLVCGTSGLWLLRDIEYVKNNVSRTIRHPVFLTSDMVKVTDYLNENRGTRAVLLALPGSKPEAFQDKDSEGKPIPDAFSSGNGLPDLNPILSGLTGVYTYVGHWSETPKYNEKVGRVGEAFLDIGPPDLRQQVLDESRAEYVLAPARGTVTGLFDWTTLGDVVVEGAQFELVKLRR